MNLPIIPEINLFIKTFLLKIVPYTQVKLLNIKVG